MDANQKWTSEFSIPLSSDAEWQQWGEILPMDFRWCTSSPTLWNPYRLMDRGLPQPFNQWVGWLVSGLKGERLKDERQEGLRKRNMKPGMKCEDIGIHVNAHQRAFTMKEALYSQVNRMTWSVDIRRTVSLATPVPVRWAYEQSNHGGRDRGSAWIHLTKKADLSIASAECSDYQEKGLLPSSWCRSILQRNQPTTLWCTNYLGPLSPWKCQQSILKEPTHSQGMGLPFLPIEAHPASLSEGLPHVWFTNTESHITSSFQGILLK